MVYLNPECFVYTYKWKYWISYYIAPESHKGLKRVTLMFALSDASDYPFSKVAYLEREEKITD